MANGVCAVPHAVISVCEPEIPSVSVQCPLVTVLVIARFGMGLEFSSQAPDRGIPRSSLLDCFLQGWKRIEHLTADVVSC